MTGLSKKRAFVRRKVKYSSVSSPVLLRSGAISNPAREKTRSAVVAKSFLADDLSVALRFPIMQEICLPTNQLLKLAWPNYWLAKNDNKCFPTAQKTHEQQAIVLYSALQLY